MTYKETLFFVGKCLTINHEDHNKKIVEDLLKESTVDWDNVVKLSTEHYVFPALYCNLKRADFLYYLPEDLVSYMEHITELNRDRNTQIIEQAKEINELLLAHNITPIFLKGTGNLLEGLYEDIAERMVGDIDFLVSDENFTKSITFLKDNGYQKFHKDKLDTTVINRHYPKMIKEDNIASIEIHYKMVSSPKISEFNYDFIFPNIKKTEDIFTLSDNDKVILTTCNKQFNDEGKTYKNFNLRSSYDLFLLSKKCAPLESIEKLKNHKHLNSFLYSCFELFNKPKSIDFKSNKLAKTFFSNQVKLLETPRSETQKKILFYKLLTSGRINKLYKAFFSKEYRDYLKNRFRSNS
ncbi:nucleotidyltransferase family protein [uncultured Tenacibaculum sp.]|uniref:nucleotidyltransferase domain-containing protein n=1 Tax=uncultured Tenacibaculum sp. TaxID=174713 RepID=UPI002611D5DF|nr:nucleotidyltransferase family protein [uncultured Tenacibaculum sp.]